MEVQIKERDGRPFVAVRDEDKDKLVYVSARNPDPYGAIHAVRAAGFVARIERDQSYVARPSSSREEKPRWVTFQRGLIQAAAHRMSQDEFTAWLHSVMDAAEAWNANRRASIAAARAQAANSGRDIQIRQAIEFLRALPKDVAREAIQQFLAEEKTDT